MTHALARRYQMGDTQINALDGVDLKIARGEYVAIMGPSGSGKSTLMNVIGCLDKPDDGEYWLNGKLVSNLKDHELARFAIGKSVSCSRLSICCSAQRPCTMSKCH